jgi:hypothetical protein
MERISAANFAVCLLQDDDLHTSTHYANLQRLIQILHKMKKYSEEITQYNTLQKFLADSTVKIIEQKFNKLCEEYDDSIDSLKLSLMVDFNAKKAESDKILKEETENVSKFQEALLEGMDTNDKKSMNKNIKQVSEISTTIRSLSDGNELKEVVQKKIDTIFNESPLPFEKYKWTGEEYISKKDEKDKVRVYTKDGAKFAFRSIEKDEKDVILNQVKNLVTIIKKIDGCQNIIRFYGFTNDSEGNHYLVTEWLGKRSLFDYIKERGQTIEIKSRLKFAYDIAKGLNFLNSIKVMKFLNIFYF